MEDELEKGEIPAGVNPEDILGGDTTPNLENETPLSNEPESVTPQPTEPEKAETSKEFQNIDAQKRHWREKALKLEKELEVAKRTSPKPKVEGEDTWKRKVEFLLQNKNYSEEEFDHISAIADRKGIALSEAAKEENDYIQFRRRKVEELNKVPTPSSSGSISGKSSADIAKMSPEEHKKLEEQERRKMGSVGI